MYSYYNSGDLNLMFPYLYFAFAEKVLRNSHQRFISSIIQHLIPSISGIAVK
jgi:hypothetical protein